MSERSQGANADPAGRARSHRALVLVTCLTVFGPLWGASRIVAWSKLDAHPERLIDQSDMFCGAAAAPLRLVPWSYDADCRKAFLLAGNRSGPWPSGCGGTTFVEMPPWEPGIVFPLTALWRLFGVPPSLTVLAGIQTGIDASVLLTICWVAFELAGPVAALTAAWAYSETASLAAVSTFPFYYYWPVPFLTALAAVFLQLSRSRSVKASVVWGGLAGALAAGGCWFRGTMVTVALVTPLVVYVLSRPAGRPLRAALCAVGTSVLVLLPSAWHQFPRNGSVLPRRQVWHDFYIGIGTRPNPYGIVHSDTYGEKIAKDRHGVAYQAPGYESAMRTEYLAILRSNPLLILQNSVQNTYAGLRGVALNRRLEARFQFFPWLCIAGLLALFLQRRQEAAPAAACALLWLVSCATLGVVKWPQESYVWETLGIATLCGAFGVGAIVEGVGRTLRRAASGRFRHVEKTD